MKQFLTNHAQDDLLAKWRSLQLDKGESIKKFIDWFWDLCLKACVFEEIGFQTQKQKYCVGLPKDMRAYINAQKPTKISGGIHHYMLAYKIFYSSPKVVAKPSKKSEKDKGKDPYDQRNHEGKKKDQGRYKGPNKLTPEELESYRKENKCFWCGEQGHVN